jgi:high-affinity iron transporter
MLVKNYSQLAEGETLSTLLASTFVVAREGFEAWLIALLAISASGNTRNIRAIWIAILTAFLATLALGSATVQFLGSHANIERFDGLIGVITGVLLAWVAWFCHGASQHVKELPYQNSLLLGLAVFGVLFREGLEVIVFLSGIISDTQDTISVGMGILVGLVILVGVGLVSHNQIKRLPVKQIFKISRWLFSALAVYFLYTGIKEIIEYGILPL